MLVVKPDSSLANTTNPDEGERERMCDQLALSWIGWELVPVEDDPPRRKGVREQ